MLGLFIRSGRARWRRGLDLPQLPGKRERYPHCGSGVKPYPAGLGGFAALLDKKRQV
jgi:hypothetical protein